MKRIKVPTFKDTTLHQPAYRTMKKKYSLRAKIYLVFTFILLLFGLATVVIPLTAKPPGDSDSASVEFWKTVPKNIYNADKIGNTLDSGFLIFNSSGKDITVDLGHHSFGELGHYYCDDATIEIQYPDTAIKMSYLPEGVNHDKDWSSTIVSNDRNYKDAVLKFDTKIPLREKDIHSKLKIEVAFKVVTPVRVPHTNTFTDETGYTRQQYDVYVVTGKDLEIKNRLDLSQGDNGPITFVGVILIVLSVGMLLYFVRRRKRSQKVSLQAGGGS